MPIIHAPYNFVPLSDWVYCPKDGCKANHDLPFKDGVSGEISYTLISETPVLVGGHQDRAIANSPGDVHFFKTPSGEYAIRGEYAIPGSSIRGMLRSVIEIAGFGRMRFVDDSRFGLRDLSGANTPYMQKIKDKIKTGLLSRGKDGVRQIIPCDMVRVAHSTLESWLGLNESIFPAGSNVQEKYKKWTRVATQKKVSTDTIQFDILKGYLADNLGSGAISGIPVFTGQIWGKKKDFIFHTPCVNKTIKVRNVDWRDFLLIHGDDGNNPQMSWPGYWRERFNRGMQVPVFYLDDGLDGEGDRKVRMGLAYMPKLAWDFSVEELIGHTSPEHLNGPDKGGRYDLADLLFGCLGKDADTHLKGRVSCGLAMVQGNPQEENLDATILNGPKPTYFPNYIKQNMDPSTGELRDGAEYASGIETTRNPKPELRGFKRYPARHQTNVQVLTEDQRRNPKVQIKLHPLPAGTEFRGDVRFHNLRPWELGALLWALTWGGNSGLRHGLGMGKSFGLGQVRFSIDWTKAKIMYNENITSRKSIDDLQPWLARFADHMKEAWSSRTDTAYESTWDNSIQLLNLLAMANPDNANRLPDGMELRHMRLGQGRGNNGFQEAKQANPKLALVDYAQATGNIPTPAMSVMERRSPPGATGELQHPWLIAIMEELVKTQNATADDIMGRKVLAEAWGQMEDEEEKRDVLKEIKSYWAQRNWWDNPSGKSKQSAKKIYEGSSIG